MKKPSLILILLFLPLFLLQAQDEDPLYTRAGFKVGLNYANITGDLDDTDARIRMHLGAVIEFPVSQRFYIQTEVLYSAQGYTIEENGIENKISLNYLALPIIAKYYFTPRFSLETGPRLATLASSSQSEGEESDEFFDTFEDFDFGWNFGAGYKSESGLFFQLHYVLGINEVINTNVIDISANTSMVQLSVGYLFKTKNNRRQQPAVQQ
ncbi:porin family protein [Aquimarina celericrescens]|uniref:Porin family protein n=1 Tax=Aquimarina celericrescens TaxID=1964542 RepID=A0ABW5ATH6_9FLAO|nr:PorT family protein [Aquimarina celericrescens]